MIQPEPTRAVYHADLDCTAGRHSWCSMETVPAAGRLGVTEEKCPYMHDRFSIRQGLLPCGYCGAAL